MDAQSRGGVWVVTQFALIGGLVLLAGLGPPWPGGAVQATRVGGAIALVAGAGFTLWAGRTLGSSLTPFPRPRVEGVLVTAGPFRYVRHPIYAGILAALVGLCLLVSPLGLVALSGLVALWVGKLRVEESHLHARFPEYADYARRVRWRLVPGVY